MKDLLSRKIVFVGGKGGVGKTTLAAALSLAAAEAGHRCLVISTDPAHSLGDVFDARIGDRPTALAERVTGLEIDPDAESDRYIATVKRNMRDLVAPAMYGEIDRQLDLARQAPGASEAALLDRVARLMIEETERHDLIVFDTAPTGHTIRLLTLPEAMLAWTDGLLRHHEKSRHLGGVLERLGGGRQGSGDDLSYIDQHDEAASAGGEDDRMARIGRLLLERRRRFHQARRLMLDSEATAFVLVLNPEKLPILETRRAVDALSKFDLPVAGIVVNRILPDAQAGAFYEARRTQEAAHLATIDRDFTGLPRIDLPMLPTDVNGMDALAEVARRLSVALDAPARP